MKIVNIIRDSSTECAPFSWGMSLFSLGCNLHCKMCEGYNYEKVTNSDNVIGVATDLINSNITPLHDCVVFIGGEPTIWSDDLTNALLYCHNKGIKTKIFTNGMLPDVVELINENKLCDAWSVDFKGINNINDQFGIDSDKYNDNWNRTINSIRKYRLPLEIRTTFFDGNLQDKDEIVKFCNDIITKYREECKVYCKYIIQNDVRELYK